MQEAKRRIKRTMVGVVVSDKMDKTVVVRVSAKVKHPTYKKYVQQSKKYKAHDEVNQCSIGDKVQITECRPLSKDKCWRISKVVEKALA
ncbi:MAG: 30S ribosomal protein S17 [Deltaproteobacteria bacterium]|nr:30S ribosomal protein S17 [Candidatus Anaeroferrophillus wilburensis]MBN2889529.1 30S ribosomal protein S17 [Deltaproteobacteria bacterium]